MGTAESGPTRRDVVLVRFALLALVAFVVLKFLVLLAEVDWDLTRSPFVPLVVVGLAAAVLFRSVDGRRWAAAVALVLMLLYIVVVATALARDGLERQSWADYPFAYGGLVAAAVGAFAAFRLVRTPARA